jgi:hypothetical protein
MLGGKRVMLGNQQVMLGNKEAWRLGDKDEWRVGDKEDWKVEGLEQRRNEGKCSPKPISSNFYGIIINFGSTSNITQFNKMVE